MSLKTDIEAVLLTHGGNTVYPATDRYGGWFADDQADGSAVIRWKYEAEGVIWAVQEQHLRTVATLLRGYGFTMRLDWLNPSDHVKKEPRLVVSR